MNLNRIINKLDLKVLTDTQEQSEILVNSGYCSDLLSCVMTGAAAEGIWVTLMAHSNIVAVAALLDIPAIIITEDAQPDPLTLAKANEKNIILLSTPESNFYICGKLWEMGLRA
jgi:serine kinase of HPr protein (carbohydrate metabolism regulator)